MGVERERLAFTRVKQICTNLTKKAKREYFKKTSEKKNDSAKENIRKSTSHLVLSS